MLLLIMLSQTNLSFLQRVKIKIFVIIFILTRTTERNNKVKGDDFRDKIFSKIKLRQSARIIINP